MSVAERLKAARASRDAALISHRDVKSRVGEADSLRDQERIIAAQLGDTEAARAQADTELTRRSEAIQAFPTEAQLLKSERRLETLKTQLAEAERACQQTSTAIEAYTVRCDAHELSRRELAGSLHAAIEQISDAVSKKAEHDFGLISGQDVVRSIEDLTAICEQREHELSELNQKFAECIDEESKLNQRLMELQQRVDGDLPKIEADAERFITSLTEAWSRERDALRSLHERLYAVNKEQQHHLVRGTHVKSAPDTYTGHEAALSARQNGLTTQLIDAKERLQELAAENAFVLRLTDQLRNEGRQSKSAAEFKLEDVTRRWTDARDERRLAEEEARKFRNLKSDLQAALMTIRDAPCH